MSAGYLGRVAALIKRNVLALPVLAHAGDVGTAVEQVEVHAHFDARVVVRTGILVVAEVVAPGDEVELGHEGGAPGVEVVLRRFDVLDAGA